MDAASFLDAYTPWNFNIKLFGVNYKKVACHLRIKSAQFLDDLSFKSAHLKSAII